ncbi:hypothetical protein OKW42_005135 [Paraburkholderia sp. WC7.3d]
MGFPARLGARRPGFRKSGRPLSGNPESDARAIGNPQGFARSLRARGQVNRSMRSVQIMSTPHCASNRARVGSFTV